MLTGRFSAGRWHWYLPVALLILVACNQIRLSQLDGLSPWSGGGFGMFSSTDTRGNRVIRAIAVRPGIRRELLIPADLNETVQRSITLPTEPRMRSLAYELARMPSVDEGNLQSIIIEVWTVQYDHLTLAPSASLFRAFKVQINEH